MHSIGGRAPTSHWQRRQPSVNVVSILESALEWHCGKKRRRKSPPSATCCCAVGARDSVCPQRLAVDCLQTAVRTVDSLRAEFCPSQSALRESQSAILQPVVRIVCGRLSAVSRRLSAVRRAMQTRAFSQRRFLMGAQAAKRRSKCAKCLHLGRQLPPIGPPLSCAHAELALVEPSGAKRVSLAPASQCISLACAKAFGAPTRRREVCWKRARSLQLEVH